MVAPWQPVSGYQRVILKIPDALRCHVTSLCGLISPKCPTKSGKWCDYISLNNFHQICSDFLYSQIRFHIVSTEQKESRLHATPCRSSCVNGREQHTTVGWRFWQQSNHHGNVAFTVSSFSLLISLFLSSLFLVGFKFILRLYPYTLSETPVTTLDKMYMLGLGALRLRNLL